MVGGDAFEKKTGEDLDYDPPISYETYSNRDGWNEAIGKQS